jgi:acyl carrier protein
MSTASASAVIGRIREYLLDNFLYMRRDAHLRDDDPLLLLGIIDSMGVMEIVALLEDEFGITVRDDEITEENLGTLSAIAGYVAARQSGGQPVQRTA